MKTKILILFLLTSFFAKAETKKDTITTWNVFYNSKLLKQFNVNPSRKEIKIKMSEYKTGDYIAIQYGDDTPCNDCKYELKVVTDSKSEVFILTTKDKYKLMKIDLKNIFADFKFMSPQKFYIVYFTEINKNGKRDMGSRLFTIQIE